MRCILKVLPIALQIVVVNGAVNYCGARMCGRSDAHTFCKYRPGPSPSCAGYIEAQLSAKEKTRVLERLNGRRSQVARGWRHWPPAGDMLKLRWVEELSREAQRWADQCRPPRAPEERDVCRDLYSISVGQCVASITGEAPGLRPESMVDMWFMQSMSYDGNVTTYMPTRANSYYEDFAQMMWSRSHLVGCGRSRFMMEWRGRLRSVERLVCNFAPRGPQPGRPLWTPADAASICPSRSRPDTVQPNLCTYRSDIEEAINSNDSLSVQDDKLLETVFEIEKNKSLDHLGRLDEMYLTKIAIATIGTPMPFTPTYEYYSMQKRDVFEHKGKDGQLRIYNTSEVALNRIESQLFKSTEKTALKSKPHRTNVNIVGRPKPYDINELIAAFHELNTRNLNIIEDLNSSKEKDVYEDNDVIQIEDNFVNTAATISESVPMTPNDNKIPLEAKSEENGFAEIINATDGMVGSKNHITNIYEEMNASLINNKTIDDYLSDPETVKALQDALDQMERTLASPRPAFSPGKVRRELRNLQADARNQAASLGLTSPSEVISNGDTKKQEHNISRDEAPMLKMVLKYMPYLKPYESSIVGDHRSYCGALCYNVFVVIGGSLLHVLVW